MRLVILATLVLALVQSPLAQAQSGKELYQRMSALTDKHPQHGELHYHLGMFLNNGIGTQRNPAEAYRHFRIAAEAGHPLAAFKVGCYHAGQFGKVVELDADKAYRYKLRAAEAGYDLAQAEVGRHLYMQGDKQAAYVWLERASHQGSLEASDSLAYVLSMDGDANAQTKALALMQMMIQRTGETPRSLQAAIDKINAQLTPAQKQAATQMQASWVTGPTPLSIEARQGLSAAQQMLNALETKSP